MISAATICLALGIYFEARSEPIPVKKEVASVILNRGPNACDIVFKPHQFSWAHFPKYNKPSTEPFLYSSKFMKSIHIVDRDSWETSVSVAKTARKKSVAKYFHSHKKRPAWTRHLVFVKKLGKMSFYTD